MKEGTGNGNRESAWGGGWNYGRKLGEGGGRGWGDRRGMELLLSVGEWHTSYPPLRRRWLLVLMAVWERRILEAAVALSLPGAPAEWLDRVVFCRPYLICWG